MEPVKLVRGMGMQLNLTQIRGVGGREELLSPPPPWRGKALPTGFPAGAGQG